MSNLIIVTGASRGLGKAISISFAKHIRGSKHFIVFGRDKERLNETKAEILQHSSSAESVDVDAHTCDLSNLLVTQSYVDTLFKPKSNIAYKRVIFVNNAASLGPLCIIGSDTLNLDAFNTEVTTNITVSCYLTSEIVKRYLSKQFFPSATELLIINISSLAGVQPFPSWGIYSMGKAAREMFHKVLAEENREKNNGVKVLNYAPGPLDTDMQKQIREGPDVDPATQAFYKSMKENNVLVTCSDSADKLSLLINQDLFITGSHFDYYDDLPILVVKTCTNGNDK